VKNTFGSFIVPCFCLCIGLTMESVNRHWWVIAWIFSLNWTFCPIGGTVIDFWRLLHEYCLQKSSCNRH
jgi:hypothetical protein